MRTHAAGTEPQLRSAAGLLIATLLCAASTDASASDFWDEVRTPGLAAYRAAVAQGMESLADNRAGDALERAQAAIEQLPQRAAAHVLHGRALARLGRPAIAIVAFERALGIDASALDQDPLAAIEAAQASIRAGRLELARSVLQRRLATAQPEPARPGLRLLCAHVLLASGPEHLHQALGLYRELLREGDDSPEVSLSLALGLHRSGDADGAVALAARVADGGGAQTRLLPSFMPDAEHQARDALLRMAVGQRREARKRWQQAARAGGPWSEHAHAQGAAP